MLKEKFGEVILNEANKEKEIDHIKPTPIEQLIPGINQEILREYKGFDLHDTDAGMRRKYGLPYMTEFQSFLDSIVNLIKEEKIYSRTQITKKLEDIFKDKIVVDIGSSWRRDGYDLAQLAGAKAYVAVDISGVETLEYILNDKNRLDRKINEIKKRHKELKIEDKYTREAVNLERSVGKIKIPYSLINADMLTFLRALPDSSVVIMASGIDHAIITDENRIKIAQEIPRILAKGGGYFSCHSLLPIGLKGESIHGESADTYGEGDILNHSIIYKK